MRVTLQTQAPVDVPLDKLTRTGSILSVQFSFSLHWKLFAAVLSLVCLLSALGQAEKTSSATTAMKAVAEQVEGDWADGRWNQVDVGPFMSAAINTPQGRTLKGIAIKVGDTSQATVCFNTELLGYSAAWTEGFLEFDSRRYGLTGSTKPKGRILFANGITPSWAHDGKLDDPRPRKLGSLPRNWARYRGLYRHGNRVVLSYTVNETGVLETPWAGNADDQLFLTRTFEFGKSAKPLIGLIAAKRGATAVLQKTDGLDVAHLPDGDETLWVVALGQGSGLAVENDRVLLTVKPGATKRLAKVLIIQTPLGQAQAVAALAKANATMETPSRLAEGGPGLWKPLTTRGVIGKPKDSFAIDTIKMPFDNPWNALLFAAGHDFLPDGSALVATVHGDIWRVEGIDTSLRKVTWRRFATGLFQPLGLKVIGDYGYVIGRDQITRLHDLNGDGEADFYECFNNDLLSAGGGHSFATSLETDSRGNFYFTKCSENTRHGGSLIRISADGSKLDVFATGFRNPNGLGIGPGDVITVGDQQGGWVPETRVDVMHQGGFYGFMPMHHRAEEPKTYDPPFAFVPRVLDNSAGGQVWVPEGHWGALGGRMIHLSYGRCTALLALPDETHPGTQGAVLRLPGRYLSGAMRGRFNPHDGHLYVSGLRGWQTSAVHDGCFQRLRFVGGALRQPIRYATRAGELELSFDVKLDRKLAEDPESYSLEQWNYLWSSQYGSKDWSIRDPKKNGRDKVAVPSTTLQPDGKTVVLSLPDLNRAMQFELKFDLDAADGEIVRGSIAGSINEL